MWRDGKLLVVGRDEAFPGWCVRTNRPADGKWFRQQLNCMPIWARPISALLFPLGWLTPLGWIVTEAATRSAVIHLGVSRSFLRRRRRSIALTCLILSGSYAAIAWSCCWGPWGDGNTWLTMGAALALGWGMFRVARAKQIVTAKRITGEFIWLKGAHPEFLARLPEWSQNGSSQGPGRDCA